ncbi:MAG: ADP-ribosylglycohydrolase [Lysobacterales bacterium]|jgi:ADP-ribosylglycohydrolase
MPSIEPNPGLIRSAWAGRVSGCILGKPMEVLSFQQGRQGITAYLEEAHALPLRGYVPLIKGTVVDRLERACCRENIERAEPDDDINYTMLALLLLEDKGIEFNTTDVARAWLNLLPAGTTWTAERSAYKYMLNHMADEFVNGAEAGFDLSECSDNQYNEWIGAQIRSDLYGWVCPGRPALAATLAIRDASLSHRGEAVHAAAFIAALGASIPATETIAEALDWALEQIPLDSKAALAVRRGQELSKQEDGVDALHEEYAGMSPVHCLNNLALVVWALCSANNNFSKAIGNAVTAGWDTDCNGATVGGLFGLTGARIPDAWTRPWAGRIGLSLAGFSEVILDEVVARTIAVAHKLAGEQYDQT